MGPLSEDIIEEYQRQRLMNQNPGLPGDFPAHRRSDASFGSVIRFHGEVVTRDLRNGTPAGMRHSG
ncbi:hypothetical protein EYF80_020163 [Liparis tanakae]|uniref:Uncharacterized protein n=1 Tax=Liparis tanakae TaxID=230148 RepID=A0A4Z2HXI0_9TELE|nr:hypothetical protein EYF80_020163 [Liparis tanakae]